MVAKRTWPAVSGPERENTAHSRNQSDRRICRIPPAHDLRKKIILVILPSTVLTGLILSNAQVNVNPRTPPPPGRDIAGHLRGIFRYLTSERAAGIGDFDLFCTSSKNSGGEDRGIFHRGGLSRCFLYLPTKIIRCYDCMWQSTMSSSMVPFFLRWNHKRAYRTLVLRWVPTEGLPGVGLQ